MLLKPATPLAVLLFIALVLLLVSVISVPIVRGIPLATNDGVDYGVFGYCKGDACTAVHVGYTSDLNSDDSNFDLPSSTRRSLSSILIVHPVAALLTLICFCMAAAAHFHAPSHSPRYLLALLILLLPTLLTTLLAFLVDILLFVPHMRWGGWIVLAATVILVSCGVVTCAMRRTLVSRKARKRRIAENAEMSGENFYNRENAAAAAASLDLNRPLVGDVKEPIIATSPGADPGPTFATFRTTTRESDDDRTPLNSFSSPPSEPQSLPPTISEGRPPARGDGPPYADPRDPMGNRLSPPGPYRPGPGMRPNGSDPRLHNQYSDGSMGSRRGPPPGFGPRGGRGGYPPRGGYGRGGSYGAQGRGGPMGSVRGGGGGPPPMMARGQRGPPPAGYTSGPGGPNRNFDPYASGTGSRAPDYGPPPPDGYDRRGPSPGGPTRRPSNRPAGMEASVDGGHIIGQAIEMQPQPQTRGSASGLPDAMDGGALHPPSGHNSLQKPLESPTSLYSRTSYVPPRAGWGDASGRTGLPSPPLPADAYGSVRPPSGPQHTRSASGGSKYYEDIEPRFADVHDAGDPPMPSVLLPGGGGELNPSTKDFEYMPEGPRSPAVSETSHFTSISERPINPRWRPPPPPVQQRRQALLENNPDFELNVGRGRAALTGPGGRIPREPSRYPIP